MVTLIGANGAGKSTTLRTISGLVRPRRARRVRRADADRRCPRTGSWKWASHAPEGRKIFSTLAVQENLDMGAYGSGNDQTRHREEPDRVFHLFPRIDERRKQFAGTLSGGEQQMLCIGRALMGSPQSCCWTSRRSAWRRCW